MYVIVTSAHAGPIFQQYTYASLRATFEDQFDYRFRRVGTHLEPFTLVALNPVRFLKSNPSNSGFWNGVPQFWENKNITAAYVCCVLRDCRVLATGKRLRPGWYRNPQCYEVAPLQLYAAAFAPTQRSNLGIRFRIPSFIDIGVGLPKTCTLPETNIAPEKWWWLGILGRPIFRCYVSSGRVTLNPYLGDDWANS